MACKINTCKGVKISFPSNVRQIALYGKGGIGKSTIACHISVALSKMGYKVLQVGCDPKRDSTRLLMNGKMIPTILEKLREANMNHEKVRLKDVVFQGYGGVLCAESGGPEPGVGCGGRAVITALEFLRAKKAFEKLNLDVVIYDILGDVVCGGFAQPIQRGYAREVYIVTSGEFMSLYAANNLCFALKRFNIFGARLGGIIGNLRNVPNEKETIENFANYVGTKVTGSIPRMREILEADKLGKTVFEVSPNSRAAKIFEKLAKNIIKNGETVVPTPLEHEKIIKFAYISTTAI
nr:nitrogenase iron protein NifH [Candidatus Baldrarchaeota archaeon]